MTAELAIWAVPLLLSAVVYLLIRILNTTEKRLNAHSKRMDEIEDNYISRFNKVNQNISDVKTCIVQEIGDVKLIMASNGIKVQ